MLSTADLSTFSIRPAKFHDHPLKSAVFRGKSERPYLQHGLVLFSIIKLEAGLNITMDVFKFSCHANNTGQGKVTSLKVWIVLQTFRRVTAK